VASRLEGLNKVFGTTILISDHVYERVKGRIHARPVQRVTVTGRDERFIAYELLGLVDTSDPELMAGPGVEHLCALSAAALKLLIADQPVEAHDAYGRILEEFPHDPVAKHLFESYGVFG
jgi:hypothetical protein